MTHPVKLRFLLVLGLSLLLFGVAFASLQADTAKTYTVNSLADVDDAAPGNGVCATVDNECTLRAAIQEANVQAGADVIILQALAYTLTQSGAGEDEALSGDLDILDDVTIQNNLVTSLTRISANGLDRVFEVRGATLTLEDIIVTGGQVEGSGAQGGGLRVDNGTLNLLNSWVMSNSSGETGGGVYLLNRAVMTQTNSHIVGNTAEDDGGGVYVSSRATFVHQSGVISNNQADYGGGMFIFQGTVTSRGSIQNNTANFWGGGVNVVDGTFTQEGGTLRDNMAGLGGGLYVFQGTAIFENGQVTGNRSLSQGGGVYVANNAEFNFRGGSISENTAVLGGGICLSQGAGMVTGATIEQNQATDGGGIYVIDGELTQTDTTIRQNTAGNDGGGLYLQNGSISQTNVVFVDNQADFGAGLYVINGLLEQQNSRVVDNSASRNGGGVYIRNGEIRQTQMEIESNTAQNGGGLYVENGRLFLAQNRIFSNTVDQQGGGMYISGGELVQNDDVLDYNQANAGGGLYAISSTIVTKIEQTGVRFERNVANSGGGFYLTGQANLSQISATIRLNVAHDGAGFFANNARLLQSYTLISQNERGLNGGDGGGGYIFGGTTGMLGNTISHNRNSDGGGLFIRRGRVALTQTNIISNVTGGQGGGLHLAQAEVGLTDLSITDNASGSSGGAIYAENSRVQGQRLSLNQNRTDGSGGGFMGRESYFTLTEVTVMNNTADGSGGGIYLDDSGLWADNLHVQGHTANGKGGGVWAENSQLDLRNSIVEQNQTNAEGGGVSAEDSQLVFQAVDVLDNAAGLDGGGLYLSRGQSVFSETRISDNMSNNNGGGIFLNTDTVLKQYRGAVSDNGALNNGGGVHNFEAEYRGERVVLKGNQAGHGGGVFVYRGVLRLDLGEVRDNRALNGGGIYHENGGNVSLKDVKLTQNRATLLGGGIYNTSSPIEVFGSTLNQNTAQSGGAIYTILSPNFVVAQTAIISNYTNGTRDAGTISLVSGQMAMSNSTISLNTTPNGQSGGVFVGPTARATLVNLTVVQNDLNALYLAGTTSQASLINSILLRHPDNCAGPGDIDSLGYNIFDDTTCPTQDSDQSDTTPTLNPLSYNGGNQVLNLTYPLPSGSQAIDRGSPEVCPAIDQRSVSRPQKQGCDVGAFEAEFDIIKATALEISSGQVLTSSNQNVDIQWYRLPVFEAFSVVTVTLSNLEADYNLYLFAPGFDEASDQVRDLGFGDGDAAIGFGDGDAAIGFGDGDAAIGFGDGDAAINGNSGSVLDPTQINQNGELGAFCQQASVGQMGNVSELVGVGTLLCVSSTPGLADELVAADVQSLTGNYYIAVSGHNFRRSAEPFTLKAEISPPTLSFPILTQTVHTTYTTPLTDTSVETLILVNPARLAGQYPSGTTPSLTQTGLLTKLTTLAEHNQVNAEIINLNDYPEINTAYAFWDEDPGNPFYANFVSSHIKALIYDLEPAYPNLRFVVIVGDDRIIPHRRVTDENLFVNQRTYANSIESETIAGAFASRHFLSDDYYVSMIPLPWRSREFYLPTYSIGRLVETPTEMVAVIDRFLSQPTLTPQDALVTGYDFLIDQAEAIVDSLNGQGFAVSSLIDNTWTADDFRQSFFTGTATTGPPDMASLNSHFDHYRFAPHNLNDVLTTAEFAGLSNWETDLIFSVGCHAGLNAPDEEATSAATGLDWAQTFASHGATFIANTGYGYGYKGKIGYSERLMTAFVAQWEATTTPASIGELLVAAKHNYYNTALALHTYDEKVMGQMTLYGLPMTQLDLPTQARHSEADSAANTALVKQEVLTGSANLRLDLSYDFDYERISEAEGDYFTLSNISNSELHLLAARPVQPKFHQDIQRRGYIARGVLIQGGSFTDYPNFDPVVTRIITDEVYTRLDSEPSYDIERWYPVQVGLVNRFSLPGGQSQEQLVVSPARFVSQGEQTGRQRLYNTLDLQVQYALAENRDFIAPSIWQTEAIIEDGELSFNVVVSDDRKRMGRVVVLYRWGGETRWSSLELSYDIPTQTASATIPAQAEVGLYYFVQAMDETGNVSLALDHGLPFTVLARQYLPLVMR